MTRVDDHLVEASDLAGAGARRRRARLLAVVAAIVGVPLLVLAGAGVWFWWQLDPPGRPGAVEQVRIERGWGVPRIGQELSDRGVVGSSLVFSVYARLRGDTKFEAGTYELRRHMGVRAAVKALRAGPRIDYVKLTIPPGLWLRQVADRVGALPGRGRDAFVESTRNGSVRSKYEPGGATSLEGLLWPDTYKISDSEDEIAVLQTLVKAFDQHADGLGLAGVTADGRTPYDVVKVASLVESEAKIDADRPLIASVIYNRLAKNMPLQIDSTLIYGRGDPANRKLTPRDLQVDTPFNTYLHTGLPPTPIDTVSAASLEAAINPAKTDFLYYVVIDPGGRHAFASTYTDWLNLVALARQRGLL